MAQAVEAGRNPSRDLAQLYAEALADYVAVGGETALRRAYEAGRAAMAAGKGVLEIAVIHHAALAKCLSGASSHEEMDRVLKRAEEFFAESLSPYEMTHRGYQEAIAALRHLNEALEQETKRIAHAVHDEASQLLIAVHLALADAARDAPPPLQDRLKSIGEILRRVEDQLRRLSRELRPTILDDLGLVPALQSLADGVSKRAHFAVQVQAACEGRLPPAVETGVYRIVQEALTNVVKHAEAKNIRIQLDRMGRTLRCSIRDDGTGFDVPAVLWGENRKGLGLVGIQERLNAMGGTLQIHSAPGQGTELLISLPLEK